MMKTGSAGCGIPIQNFRDDGMERKYRAEISRRTADQ